MKTLFSSHLSVSVNHDGSGRRRLAPVLLRHPPRARLGAGLPGAAPRHGPRGARAAHLLRREARARGGAAGGRAAGARGGARTPLAGRRSARDEPDATHSAGRFGAGGDGASEAASAAMVFKLVLDIRSFVLWVWELTYLIQVLRPFE